MTKILFTRPIDDASRQTLETAKIDYTETSFLRYTPSVSDDVLRAIRAGLSQHLVFTSQNAVRIFFQTLDNKRLKLPQSTQCYAISGSTKMMLQKFNYIPTLTADSAKLLARAIIKKGGIKDVTFVCGNLRLPDLPNVLTKNGISVQELVVYRTEWTPLSIRTAYDAIVFFSTSAVDSFLINNKLRPDMLFFTLGKTTATYLKKKIKAQNIHIAPKPELPILLETIVQNCV
ncbi:MAG: uroporphyrinogen-III synthase [Saprospiraceae bacterium]|nr:uroporphyrinogen-III synthase [Saprospiraceae bacterium]